MAITNSRSMHPASDWFKTKACCWSKRVSSNHEDSRLSLRENAYYVAYFRGGQWRQTRISRTWLVPRWRQNYHQGFTVKDLFVKFTKVGSPGEDNQGFAAISI